MIIIHGGYPNSALRDAKGALHTVVGWDCGVGAVLLPGCQRFSYTKEVQVSARVNP